MEASFKNRVEQAFGALLGSLPQEMSVASSSSGSANSWSVSEVAIPSNQGSGGADDSSSGSESDEPCAARYEKFVKLAKRARRRQSVEDEGFRNENDIEDLNDLDDLDDGRATKRRRGGELTDPVAVEDGHELPEDLDEEEECRQVRLMVGMDDTLDFEEEEDEYDKVAVGREGAGEIVYMSEVTGGGHDISPLTPLEIPILSSEKRRFRRDARANHAAAAARLEEDDRVATIEYADVLAMRRFRRDAKANHAVAAARLEDDWLPTRKNADAARVLSLSCSSGSAGHREPSGNGVDVGVASLLGGSGHLTSSIEPALKTNANVADNCKTEAESRKSNTIAPGGSTSNGAAQQKDLQKESSKDTAGHSGDTQNGARQGENATRRDGKVRKVRFAVNDDVSQEKECISGKDVQKIVAGFQSKNRQGRVPDHVLNPSKYTHYTLEWSDEEDDSKANLVAFQETRAMTRAREEHATTGIVELPKSIPFTPRRGGGASNKSNGEAKHSTASGFQQSQALVSFVEEVVIDNTPQSEEALLSTTSANVPTEAKPARIFRKRAREDDNDGNAL